VNFRAALASLQTEAPVSGGHYQRRLDADSPLALFAAVLHPGLAPALLAEVSQEALLEVGKFPACRGLAFEIKAVGPGTGRSLVTWYPKSKADHDVFLSLAEDLQIASCDSAAEKSALLALIDRLSAWQTFLGREGRLLSRPEQEGLIGELTLIGSLLDLGHEEGLILSHWLGPEAAAQDFVFPNVSIEVKVSAPRPNATLLVSNLRQLDETLVPALFVALVSFEEESGGLTLPQVVHSLRARFSGSRLRLFENRLLKTGYRDEDSSHYAQAYLSNGFSWFAVRGDFPRLRRSEINGNITDAQYQVRLDALLPFQVEEGQVLSLLNSTAHE
jgi:hypothetical protein